MVCNLCPRQCKALRTETENLNGYCKMPLLPKVARADLHFWEEPIISGKNGSGTVFFSGCPLSCVYCQNFDISQEGNGKIISYEELADILEVVYALAASIGCSKEELAEIYQKKHGARGGFAHKILLISTE